jgi:hypothetical protein
LVIRKQLLLVAAAAAAATGTSPVRSASGASGAFPVVGPLALLAEIQALIVDIDCIAKEWTEMFDEMSAGAELRIPRIDFRSLTRPSVSAVAAALVSLRLRTQVVFRSIPLQRFSCSQGPLDLQHP